MGRYQIDFKQKQANAKYKSSQQTQNTKAEILAAIKANSLKQIKKQDK
ncbi:hypothetical protein GCM10025879_19460 [Leuconostoc litchii]|nr:hypothetical protein [Leuconostoc litchii]GMA70700.1 hypothetical protein GCM10025879_19460 [Leuconostoc litchii]